MSTDLSPLVAGRDFYVARVGTGSTGLPGKVGSLSMLLLGENLLEWMERRQAIVLIAWTQDGPVGMCAIERIEAQTFLAELARPITSEIVEGRLAVVRCCQALTSLANRGIERAMLVSAMSRLASEEVTAVFAQAILPAGQIADTIYGTTQFDAVAELTGAEGSKLWLVRRKLALAA